MTSPRPLMTSGSPSQKERRNLPPLPYHLRVPDLPKNPQVKWFAADDEARPQATKPPANSLQVLTSTTSLITTSLLSHINASPSASAYPIPTPPAPSGTQIILHLPPSRRLTLSELQRLKRQFESVQTRAQSSGSRAAGLSWSEGAVAGAFVRFLETHWGTDG